MVFRKSFRHLLLFLEEINMVIILQDINHFIIENGNFVVCLKGVKITELIFFFKWCDVLPVCLPLTLIYRPARRSPFCFWRHHWHFRVKNCIFSLFFCSLGQKEKESWCLEAPNKHWEVRKPSSRLRKRRKDARFPLGQDKMAPTAGSTERWPLFDSPSVHWVAPPATSPLWGAGAATEERRAICALMFIVQ